MELPTPPVFTFSASQVNTWRDCNLKWGWQYVDKYPRDSGAAAALGTETHLLLEDWLSAGKPPATGRAAALAKALLPLLPLPTHPDMQIEHEFRVLLPVGAARGFIDVFIPQPAIEKLAPGPWVADKPIVMDHKTTSNLIYAKTTEDLRSDPQALLYGLAARVAVPGCDDVQLNWNYVQTRGARETLPVHLLQTKSIFEDHLPAVLDTAREMAAAAALPTKELDYDLRSCEKYGGCSFKSFCPRYANTRQGGKFNGEWPVKEPQEDALVQIDSEFLKRAQALSANRALITPTPPPAVAPAPAATPAPANSFAEPSPEPPLTHFDTSGLDTPLETASPINPPDAVPDVTEEDPPPPPLAAKPKRGRKAAAPVAGPAPVPTGDVESTLRGFAEAALQSKDYKTAAALSQALANLQDAGRI